MTSPNDQFSMRSNEDLLEKLASDLHRVQKAEPTSRESQYAALDFFLTAQRLPEWIAADRSDLSTHLNGYPDADVIAQIANGTKHFRVENAGQQAVNRPGRASAPVLAGTFSARDCQTRLVVDGPDGQSIDVVALASAVYRYWLVVITAHGG